ncbi:hypothetical protein [Macrococcus armenti]|nr:hypothetical protein [Macrococcus armenti]
MNIIQIVKMSMSYIERSEIIMVARLSFVTKNKKAHIKRYALA